MRKASWPALLCGLILGSGLLSTAAPVDAAPDFILKDLNGKKVRLSKVYKEGPVMLSFWSTWCKNCPDEMKHFQRFYDKYKKQGFTVLGISIDDNKTVSKVRPWVMGRRFTFPILFDTKHDAKQLYHVKPVPHSFLVDQKGQIVYSHVGYRPGDEVAYEKELLKLLGQKPAEDAEDKEETGGAE